MVLFTAKWAILNEKLNVTLIARFNNAACQYVFDSELIVLNCIVRSYKKGIDKTGENVTTISFIVQLKFIYIYDTKFIIIYLFIQDNNNPSYTYVKD